MSSRLKVTKGYMTSAERLILEMGTCLQKAAVQNLKNKIESGEAKIVNGRYVGLVEQLPVRRGRVLYQHLKLLNEAFRN